MDDEAVTEECRFAGPYHPVGDIDWVCRTHGDVVLELIDPNQGYVGLSRASFRCPVADPRVGDHPLAYENRSLGGAR